MKIERYTQSHLPLTDFPSVPPPGSSEACVIHDGEEFYIPPQEQEQLTFPITAVEFALATQDVVLCQEVLAPTIVDYSMMQLKPKAGIHTLFAKNLDGEIIPSPQPEIDDEKARSLNENLIAAMRQIREHYTNDATRSDRLKISFDAEMKKRLEKIDKPRRERPTIFHPASQTSSSLHPRR